MKSFDEWLDTTKLRGYMDENSLEAAWEAGQQSKQTKIDELQKRINNIKSIVDNIFPYDMDMDTTHKINEIKELLK